MNLCCDWQTERAKWRYLARSGLPAVSLKKNLFLIPTNPLLTKLVRFMDRDGVEIHKHAKKNPKNLGVFMPEIRKQFHLELKNRFSCVSQEEDGENIHGMRS